MNTETMGYTLYGAMRKHYMCLCALVGSLVRALIVF